MDAGTGLALLAGAGVVAAAAAAATSQDPQRLVRTGMDKFRRNDVEGSLADFDAALALGGDRIRPYLWQRGLSCYYVGQFEEGAKQVPSKKPIFPFSFTCFWVSTAVRVATVLLLRLLGALAPLGEDNMSYLALAARCSSATTWLSTPTTQRKPSGPSSATRSLWGRPRHARPSCRQVTPQLAGWRWQA